MLVKYLGKTFRLIDDSNKLLVCQSMTTGQVVTIPSYGDIQIINDTISSRNLNSEKINIVMTYVNDIYPKSTKILEHLIRNIQYFTAAAIIHKVRKQFTKFLNYYGNYKCGIFVEATEKWSSECWLLVEIFDLIPKHFQIFTGKTEIRDVDHLIIIDDAVYSGVRMTSLIDWYVNQNKLSLHLITALATNSGQNTIMKFVTEENQHKKRQLSVRFYFDQLIETVTELFSEMKSWKYYNTLMNVLAENPTSKEQVIVSNQDNEPEYDPTTVFLENKLPGEFSTVIHLIKRVYEKKPDNQILELARRRANNIPELFDLMGYLL